jgi:hypothetical protein
MAVILLGTEPAEGTGIVVLNDGKLTGGDTVLAYNGTYFQNGDRFSASVRTQRHSPGQPSVFSIDNLAYSFSMRADGKEVGRWQRGDDDNKANVLDDIKSAKSRSHTEDDEKS